jgi:CheY-like chemotaxis protein
MVAQSIEAHISYDCVLMDYEMPGMYSISCVFYLFK